MASQQFEVGFHSSDFFFLHSSPNLKLFGYFKWRVDKEKNLGFKFFKLFWIQLIACNRISLKNEM